MVRDHRSNKRTANALCAGTTEGRLRRREFLAVGVGIGSALVAGCAGLAQDTQPDEHRPAEGSGRFRLLISDQPAAIEDFSELNVTFEKARIFRAELDEGSEENADGSDDPDNASEIASDEIEDDDRDSDDEDDDVAHEDGPDDDREEDEPGEPEGDDEELEDDDRDEDEDAPEPEDGEEREETEDEEDEEGGFVEIDLDGERADLTELVGDRATQIAELPLESGRYSSIHLYVDDVDGVASDQYDPDPHPGRGNGGNRQDDGGPPRESDDQDDLAEDDDAEEPVELDVKIPSEKLKIVRPFEIAPEQDVGFVFDINVIRRGHAGYLLKPVIGESGIVGEDIEIEAVDGADREGGGIRDDSSASGDDGD